MNKTSGVIQDLTKAPLPGDIYDLGNNEYVTVISVHAGEVRYAPGAVEISAFREATEEVMRSTLAMPYRMFRKWLATISSGRRVDTPPPG
jgi:hypothetical protein